MKKIVSLLFLTVIYSCSGNNPPNPHPTPPPTPGPDPKPRPLLLRQPAPPKLVRDGVEFKPFGAIQCCDAFAPEIAPTGTSKLMQKPPRKPKPFIPEGQKNRESACNTRWPLASECWMDYTHSKGANFYHFRMGPFYGDADHESEWADIGGPYVGGPGSDWNPRFWETYRSLLNHASSLEANVEVNVVDTWYCKHAQWGDQPMPWSNEAIDSCGRKPHPEVEKFIRKVVSEAKDCTWCTWITDNEGGEIQGESCSWFEWVRNVIRDEENRSGGAVRLVGTNNPRCATGPFDYIATHAKTALTTPIAGKHTENNERNPTASPEQEYSNFCAAQKAGLHWWFWRDGMSDADFYSTINLFSQGCDGGITTECFAPLSDDPLWEDPPVAKGSPQLRWPINSAKLAVGEKCGTDHEGTLVTIGLLAAEMRKRGYCASGPWGDALVVGVGGGMWQEHHTNAFSDGCWANNLEVLPKYTWHYLGTPPPNRSCSSDPPATDEIACKLHQATNGIYDCTPRSNHQQAVPEGTPDRQACELKSMGGASPTFILKSSGGLQLLPRDNPMQFQIKGSGSGLVTCTIPGIAGELCNIQVSR